MNISTSVLNTVTALGADCSIVNKQILVKGLNGLIPQATLKPTSVIAPVTEVLQVTTYTPTAANSTQYALVLTYTNKVSKQVESQTFYYTTAASGDTATTIGDSFRAQINAASPIIPIVASGTTTLILTAAAGYAVFQSDSIGVGVLTGAATTPGVVRVGYGEDIIKTFAEPAVVASVTPTSYYYQVIMDYGSPDYGTNTMTNSDVVNRALVFALSTATNIETLVGTYGTLTYALAGKNATWVASGGTIAYTVTTGVITIATDTFASAGLNVGDITLIGATTALAVAQPSEILSILTQATAVGTNVTAVGAATGFYVKFA